MFAPKDRMHLLEMQLDALRVLKAFMNNDYGVEALMSEMDGVGPIVLQFAPKTNATNDNNNSNLNLMHKITKLSNEVSTLSLGMLSVLCWSTGDSSFVYDCFLAQRTIKREDVPFESVVARLSDPTSSGELCTAIMTFINDLINNQLDLTSRVRARSPFMTMRMKEHAREFVKRMKMNITKEKELETKQEDYKLMIAQQKEKSQRLTSPGSPEVLALAAAELLGGLKPLVYDSSTAVHKTPNKKKTLHGRTESQNILLPESSLLSSTLEKFIKQSEVFDIIYVSIQAKRAKRASIEWSTVVSISIPPPSFKLVSLPSSHIPFYSTHSKKSRF